MRAYQIMQGTSGRNLASGMHRQNFAWLVWGDPEFLNGRTAWTVHHIFPKAKEFSAFFSRLKIDPENPLFMSLMARGRHIHTGFSARWNSLWREFIEANPEASIERVLDFARGISDAEKVTRLF